jgi:hypothetical protein
LRYYEIKQSWKILSRLHDVFHFQIIGILLLVISSQTFRGVRLRAIQKHAREKQGA